MRRMLTSMLAVLCLGLLTAPSAAVTLEAALDAEGVATYTTGGDALWRGQLAVSHDGEDAAQSGAIRDSQVSALETVVDALTDKYLSFWWRVSSRDGCANLSFSVDGDQREAISGESGWRRMVLPLAAGSRSLRWAYEKWCGLPGGADAGWVDQFSLSVDPPVLDVAVRAPDAPGAAVQCSPPDDAGQTGGPTPLALRYPFGTEVQLAASEVPDRMVKEWQGCAPDPADPFVCRLTVSGVTSSVTLSYTAPLAVGLDAPGWEFEESGGPGRWRTIDTDGHEGGDAGFAFVGPGEVAWVQTSQSVSPSGYLAFFWRVRAWGSGTLDFFLDGAPTPTASIAGGPGWQEVVVPVAAGLHTLRWELRGGDAAAEGWLDEVRFTTQSFSYPLRITSPMLEVEVVANPPDLYFQSAGATPFTLTYEYGASSPVILTAPPAPDGFSWGGWQGCDSTQGGQGEQCVVTMTSSREVLAGYAITLANALDQPGWQIDTGLEHSWAGVDEGLDGADSAASSVEAGGSSWMQATADLAEGGYLTFWWSVDAWGSGTLEVFLDGSPTPLAGIDGWPGWQQVVVPVSPGTHTLRWQLTGGDGRASGRVDLLGFGALAPVYALDVGSGGGSVVVTASPPDVDGLTGGTTPFTLHYPWSPTGEVTLAAPAPGPGYSWSWEGCDRVQGPGSAECVVAVTQGRYVQVSRKASLAAAVEQPGWTVETGGSSPWTVWYGGHEGQDCARGESSGESSWMQAAPSFAAAGTLSFWWRIDSWGCGTLDFFLDGSPTPAASIGGDKPWQQVSVFVPAGTHTLRWEVRGGNDYAEAGVDGVAFTLAVTASFPSQGANDGWVLESGEASGRGGSRNASSATLLVGDDPADRQYRGILSFDTAGLPDNATVRDAVLRIRRESFAGANPFVTHGALAVDIRKGAFSGRPVLENGDFQAAATVRGAGTVGKDTGAGLWHSGTLGEAARRAVNLGGITQVRLRFARDDNDDADEDAVRFWSGSAATGSRPRLVITYTVP